MVKFKNLLKKILRKNGINFLGKKTIRYRGKGHKRTYRFLNFFYNIWNILGIIKKIEYDPFRSSYIFFVCYKNGIMCWLLATYLVSIGHFIQTNNLNFFLNGNSLSLFNISLGIKISQLQCIFNLKIKFLRAAGSFSCLLFFLKNYILLSFKSLEKKLISFSLVSTLGKISNLKYILSLKYKAGQTLWNNKKSKVRGIAMNPVDHPNGGNTPGKYYLSYKFSIWKYKRTKKIKKNLHFILK